MKILFLTSMPREYSASANMRNIALISGLTKLKYKVDVLCPSAEPDSKFVDKSCDLSSINNIIRLNTINNNLNSLKNKNNTLKSKIFNLIKKIYLSFSIYDGRKVFIYKLNKLEINEEYDILISSSDPKSSHLLAEHLFKKNKNIAKLWIQYWGDPFASDINDKRKYIKSKISKEENRLLGLADKVVYVSPFTKEEQKEKYPINASKMIFCPIPYLKEKKFSKNVHKNKITFGYFGDYYSKNRNICNLYNTISDDKNYNLVIYGNSDIKLNSLSNIEVKERQSLARVEEKEKECDILVCVCNKNGTQIPGKIYHYAATNKPILIILDGNKKNEMKKFFDSFNRFYTCDNNKIEIRRMLEIIMHESKNFYPCEKLNCENVAREFISECLGIKNDK